MAACRRDSKEQHRTATLSLEIATHFSTCVGSLRRDYFPFPEVGLTGLVLTLSASAGPPFLAIRLL